MSFMESFEKNMEKVLVPVAVKLNSQAHISAVRDAFVLVFPLIMAGSIIVLLNFAVLDEQGFIAKILFLKSIFPNLNNAKEVFSPVLQGTNNIIAILVAFLVARNLAQIYKQDDLLCGLTSIAAFFIIYTPYQIIDGKAFLPIDYLGPAGLLVAVFVGLVTGEIFSRLATSPKLMIKMPDQVPPAVARSFKILIPVIIMMIIFSLLNYVIKLFSASGINSLVYTLIQSPMKDMATTLFTVMLLGLISNLFWVLGIHGPNTIAAIRDTIFAEPNAANLNFVNEHGTSWGAPYISTWGGLNDAFANYGGSGMTLGLLIAIFIASRRQDYKDIAKLSIVPGFFNINEPVIFGLPIVLNPILIIPFVLAPAINTVVGYLFITSGIIPPVAYQVPWTTPGPLIPFLGTGGHWGALMVGFLCLGISILVYLPFVLVSNRVNINKAKEEANLQKA